MGHNKSIRESSTYNSAIPFQNTCSKRRKGSSRGALGQPIHITTLDNIGFLQGSTNRFLHLRAMFLAQSTFNASIAIYLRIKEAFLIRSHPNALFWATLSTAATSATIILIQDVQNRFHQGDSSNGLFSFSFSFALNKISYFKSIIEKMNKTDISMPITVDIVFPTRNPRGKKIQIKCFLQRLTIEFIIQVI